MPTGLLWSRRVQGLAITKRRGPPASALLKFTSNIRTIDKNSVFGSLFTGLSLSLQQGQSLQNNKTLLQGILVTCDNVFVRCPNRSLCPNSNSTRLLRYNSAVTRKKVPRIDTFNPNSDTQEGTSRNISSQWIAVKRFLQKKSKKKKLSTF
jgi:hypothetical protein